jgi:hypothetical protein
VFVPGSICVYLIEAPAVGMWKVGLSRNPLERLANLQTGSPVRLSLHSFVRVPKGKAAIVEQAIHERLRRRRKWGECRGDQESGTQFAPVVAALIHKAVGDQLTCLFVDSPSRSCSRSGPWG